MCMEMDEKLEKRSWKSREFDSGKDVAILYQLLWEENQNH